MSPRADEEPSVTQFRGILILKSVLWVLVLFACASNLRVFFFFFFFLRNSFGFPQRCFTVFNSGFLRMLQCPLEIWKCIWFLLLKWISLKQLFLLSPPLLPLDPVCELSHCTLTQTDLQSFFRLAQLYPLPRRFEDVPLLMSLGPCDIFSGVEMVGCRTWRCVKEGGKKK